MHLFTILCLLEYFYEYDQKDSGSCLLKLAFLLLLETEFSHGGIEKEWTRTCERLCSEESVLKGYTSHDVDSVYRKGGERSYSDQHLRLCLFSVRDGLTGDGASVISFWGLSSCCCLWARLWRPDTAPASATSSSSSCRARFSRTTSRSSSCVPGELSSPSRHPRSCRGRGRELGLDPSDKRLSQCSMLLLKCTSVVNNY